MYELVPLVDAHLGLMYVVDKNDQDEEILSLKGSYAYKKRKNVSNHFKLGEVYYGTNDISNHRLNINSQFKLSKTLTVGSQLQFGFETNPSGAVSQVTPNPTPFIEMRRAEIYIASDTYGTFLLGKGELRGQNLG